MIRINLLPVRQARKRQFGKQQLLIGLVVLLVEVGVLFYFYSGLQSELADRQAEAGRVQSEVSELEQTNEVITQLNQQKQQLETMARVLEDLEANRAGPVQVLDELKVMLNSPANDLERVAQQRRGWDTSWDPRNLWLVSFNETDGQLSIRGRAVGNDDLAEFLTRLSGSVYFTDVEVEMASATNTPGVGRTYEFALTATVNYGIVDDQG